MGWHLLEDRSQDHDGERGDNSHRDNRTMTKSQEDSSQGQQQQQQRSPTRHTSMRKEKFQKSLNFYIGIEATWHVCLFAACYRYRPLLKISRTSTGKRAIDRLQTLIKGKQHSNSSSNNNYGKWKGYYQNAVHYVPGGQRSLVAASEWFFFNKVIGLPLLPTKLLLAGWMSRKWEEHKDDVKSWIGDDWLHWSTGDRTQNQPSLVQSSDIDSEDEDE